MATPRRTSGCIKSHLCQSRNRRLTSNSMMNQRMMQQETVEQLILEMIQVTVLILEVWGMQMLPTLILVT
ncbi:unnamed protein product [Timema podura]|uniref:Uncharacterized protein n=1 Tax=Timema podura TaxID=61482 RepID=A0ABN7PJF1_TIMPD|nr:unnamed protein product [Timema podura]